MTTYYVDPAGSNTSPYDTWAKAATSLQTAVDLAVAGDTVYARGTETLTAAINIDTNSGSTAGGLINVIGCAADGSIDGTRYILDGNSAATNCILFGGTVVLVSLENIECKNATGDGIGGGSSNDYLIFNNVISHNNGDGGFDLTGQNYQKLIRCRAYNNSGDGLAGIGTYNFILFSTFNNNSDKGVEITGNVTVFIGCLFHDNGNAVNQIDDLDRNCLLFNCVVDGTDVTGAAKGINSMDYYGAVIGCRITNFSGVGGVGLSPDANMLTFYGWNYFHNNTTDYENSPIPIPMDADRDTNEADVDADDGYNAIGTDDFNLKASRTLRSTAIGLNIGS